MVKSENKNERPQNINLIFLKQRKSSIIITNKVVNRINPKLIRRVRGLCWFVFIQQAGTVILLSWIKY